MPIIRCIRHGQSASNAGFVTEYPDTIPLTELGHRQAACVAASFATSPSLVVFSAFDRAAQTAAPLCQRFPDVPVAVWPIQEFTYLAPFRYAGTRREDRVPTVIEYWRRLDPDHRDGIGAETFTEYWQRVEVFLSRCRELRGLVAVVSHGQFLRGVMLRLLCGEMPEDEAMTRFKAFRLSIPMPNAAMISLHLSVRGDRIGPVAIDHVPGDWRTT
jgi:broad specificity phosphatase PhoE